jgi:hypothetical protein
MSSDFFWLCFLLNALKRRKGQCKGNCSYAKEKENSLLNGDRKMTTVFFIIWQFLSLMCRKTENQELRASPIGLLFLGRRLLSRLVLGLDVLSLGATWKREKDE